MNKLNDLGEKYSNEDLIIKISRYVDVELKFIIFTIASSKDFATINLSTIFEKSKRV